MSSNDKDITLNHALLFDFDNTLSDKHSFSEHKLQVMAQELIYQICPRIITS